MADNLGEGGDEQLYQSVIRAILLDDASRLESLLRRGADANARVRSDGGEAEGDVLERPGSPVGVIYDPVLVMAARAGKGGCVRVLLKHGAAVDGRDAIRQQQPLTTAILSPTLKNGDVIDRLLVAGADVNDKDLHGWAALDHVGARARALLREVDEVREDFGDLRALWSAFEAVADMAAKLQAKGATATQQRTGVSLREVNRHVRELDARFGQERER
ncbi:MAG: hypothetical protein AAF628_34035 [Planctomycetota bacterium]